LIAAKWDYSEKRRKTVGRPAVAQEIVEQVLKFTRGWLGSSEPQPQNVLSPITSKLIQLTPIHQTPGAPYDVLVVWVPVDHDGMGDSRD